MKVRPSSGSGFLKGSECSLSAVIMRETLNFIDLYEKERHSEFILVFEMLLA